jgi:phosphoserine phosphatase RsbU/P
MARPTIPGPGPSATPAERMRALEARSRRSQRALDAFHTITLACRGLSTVRGVFEVVAGELLAIFPCDLCSLAYVEPRSPEKLCATLTAGVEGFSYAEDVAFDARTRLLLNTPGPLLEPGDEADPRPWLGVGLRVGDDALGAVALRGEAADAYDESDVELLGRLATVAAVALENAALEQQHRALSNAMANQVAARTVELATLSAVASELVVQQPLPALLERALDLIVPLFGLEGGAVRVLDAAREELTLHASTGFPPSYVAQAEVLPVAGTMAQVVRENRPLAVAEGLEELLGPATPRPFPYESLLAVPLRSGERVLGVLSLFGRRPRQFSQQEVDLAQALGNQIAIASENARLFEEQERQIAQNLRLLGQRERQIGELDAIGTIGKLIAGSFDFDEMLDGIYRTLHSLTRASVFFLAICDPRTLAITNAIFIEGDERVPLDWTGRPPKPHTLTAWILEHRQPLRFDDLATDRSELVALGVTPQPLGPENPVRSWVGVPLLASEGQAIGILAIQDYVAYRYDEGTVTFLSQVATHLSLGVQKIRLYEESLRRVEQELEIARRIQSGLFPKELPAFPDLDIAAECLPARETGGDFYDFVVLGERRLAITVGDASGKSIPAAMLMAVARSITRSEARDHRHPEAVLRETNILVAADVPPRAFVALSYATLDLACGQLALANAGQLTPLRYRGPDAVEYLPVPGPTLPLGILPDTAYAAREIDLEPGDLLLFYTDGIVEAKDAAGELYGFERLEALLRAHGQLSARQLIDRILAEVHAFMGDTPQHDDMTLVAARYQPPRTA